MNWERERGWDLERSLCPRDARNAVALCHKNDMRLFTGCIYKKKYIYNTVK